MNIDDRIEALTQSVELLAGLHKDHDARLERLDLIVARLDKIAARLDQRDTRLESLVTDIAEGTARLLRVVEAHEQRISDLEEHRPQ